MTQSLSKKKQRQLDRQHSIAQQRQQQKNATVQSPRSLSLLFSPFERLDSNLATQLNLNQEEFDCQINALLNHHAAWFLQSAALFDNNLRVLSSKQRRQLLRAFEHPQTLELAAFAIVQLRNSKQTLKPSVVASVDDERCFCWRVGWWNAAWDALNCQQEWHGDPICLEYFTLDLAIDLLCVRGLILERDRARVKDICLRDGECWCRDKHEADWAILPVESQPITSNPNAPLWLLLDRGEYCSFLSDNYEYIADDFNFAILEPFRVDWMQSKGQVLRRHKTLSEILAAIYPHLTWNDLEYQARWIGRVVAKGFGSYSYCNASGRRLQISREKSLEEAAFSAS